MPKGVYDRKSSIERFCEKVDNSDTEVCWIWTGSTSSDGYGWFTDNKKTVQAHRFAYKHYIGEIPKEQIVRHTCDVRACVNPFHMELGTHADNSKDMTERNRQAKGETNSQAQLSEGQAISILIQYRKDKEDGKLYGSLQRLATQYGVDKQIISRLTAGKTWKHLHE